MPKTPIVIDISHWNLIDDWAGLYAAGIRGVIHKATEGISGCDPVYVNRRARALDAGLLWGAYHFLRPGDMMAQARKFLSVVRPTDGTLLCADHEDAGVSLADLKLFLRTIGGHVVYGGDVLKRQLGTTADEELAGYRLWLSQYGAKAEWPVATWPMWWLWQYTDQGKISGASTVVDLSAYSGVDLAKEWAL